MKKADLYSVASVKSGVDVEFLFENDSIKTDYSVMRICRVSNNTIELDLMRKKFLSKVYEHSKLWSLEWNDVEKIIFDIVWEFSGSGGGTGIPNEIIYSLSVNFISADRSNVVVSQDFACSKLLVDIAKRYNVDIVDDKNILSIID